MERGAGTDARILGRRGAVALLAVSAFCLLGIRVNAAGRARMTVSLGLAGRVVPGRWTPLTVRIEGISHPVTVEIARAGAVEQFACRTGRYSLECPVFVEETGSEIEVRLREGRRILVEQSLDPAASFFPGHLVLAVDVPSRVQQAVAKALLPEEPVATADLNPDELPRHAWSYDGVSALVMRDPGPVLDPAQARALRAWLAGGGRLLLLDRRPGSAGIWSMFSISDWSGRRRFGLGEVAEGGREAEDPGRVRRVLGLVPYKQAVRLTPSRCFAIAAAGAPARPMPALIRPIMAGWFLLILMPGLILGRKKALPSLVLATIACVLISLPIGRSLARDWRRGATLRTFAVILPENGGAYVKTGVSLARSEHWLPSLKATHWGASLRSPAGGEGGRFVAGETFVWRHGEPLPGHVVTENGPALGLAGFVPFNSNLHLPGPKDGDALPALPGAVLWDRGRWFAAKADGSAEPRWAGIEGKPAWLGDDGAWLDGLFALYPRLPWLVGRDRLGLNRLSVEGAAERDTLWARPLTGVAR